MRVKNEDLLSLSGPVDLTSSANLRAVWLGHIVNYSVQLVFTGTPGGNFKLQCSNDPGRIDSEAISNQASDVSNWTDVADSALVVSAAGNVVWDVQNVGYNWVRVVWTATSGSGSLTSARCYVKGV